MITSDIDDGQARMKRGSDHVRSHVEKDDLILFGMEDIVQGPLEGIFGVVCGVSPGTDSA